MKPLIVWLPSVLIVSALLLSIVNSDLSGQNRAQSLPQNRRAGSANNEQNRDQPTTRSKDSAPATASANNQNRTADTGNSPNDSNVLPSGTWSVISSQTSFNAVLTVATIFIAIFNYQLLFLSRPILVADRPIPKYFPPSEIEKAHNEGKVFPVASAQCPFRNVGQSPAIILKILAKMKLGHDLDLPPSFDDCVEETAVKDKVVPASEASEFYSIYDKNRFSEEEWKGIIDAEAGTKVLLYGQIHYRGTLWKTYVMHFGFIYEPPNSWFGAGNVFRFGRREYNTII